MGSFIKFIKFMSMTYLLPLKVDYKDSKIEFKFLSINTFLNFIIVFVPFLVTVILWSYQPDYIVDVFNSLFEIYSTVDLATMVINPGLSCLPFGIFATNCLTSVTFASVRDISLDQKIKFPRNFRITLFAIMLSALRKGMTKATSIKRHIISMFHKL